MQGPNRGERRRVVSSDHPGQEDLVNRSMLMTLAGSALAAAGPAAASRPAPHPPGWTIYGDVIVEVVSPGAPQTGMPGAR